MVFKSGHAPMDAVFTCDPREAQNHSPTAPWPMGPAPSAAPAAPAAGPAAARPVVAHFKDGPDTHRVFKPTLDPREETNRRVKAAVHERQSKRDTEIQAKRDLPLSKEVTPTLLKTALSTAVASGVDVVSATKSNPDAMSDVDATQPKTAVEAIDDIAMLIKGLAFGD